MKREIRKCAALAAAAFLAFSCGYGEVGGADKTDTYTGARIAEILEPMTSVWYSHYAKRKLDGYRIGKWRDREALIPPEKQALFPGWDIGAPRFKTASSAPPQEEDYFIFYDDTVYEITPGDGGNGGWEDLVTRYIGIVRAVNIFNGGPGAGAVIIEYLDGAYPTWSRAVLNRPLPFFGMHYRVINPDCIQMANAVHLENLAAGRPYHVETPDLEAAIAQHTPVRDGEFIAWGIVIPQDREP
ncbi:MAG: hypothetical protein LBD13_01565 [Spirochaetaceae bacterium]|nr:hypothetical protein [Spirochaetaceae bacterium]